LKPLFQKRKTWALPEKRELEIIRLSKSQFGIEFHIKRSEIYSTKMCVRMLCNLIQMKQIHVRNSKTTIEIRKWKKIERTLESNFI
jgi:hypothetical protein